MTTGTDILATIGVQPPDISGEHPYYRSLRAALGTYRFLFEDSLPSARLHLPPREWRQLVVDAEMSLAGVLDDFAA